MRNNVVSIVVPCYNGEAYMDRLMDSICAQTYKSLQLIFVNDGSTDGTDKIFHSYRTRLREKAIRCVYIFQKNQGQAAAINAALPYVEGEYLMWIDADDFITDDHIEQKVACLERHSDCAIVRCQGTIVDERDLNLVKGNFSNENTVGTLFEDLLFGFCGCTGGLFMVRSKVLFDMLPERKIYPSRTGQNFQLLLPITYSYKSYDMKETLFYYVEREKSHSRSFHGIDSWHKRLDDINDIKSHVLHDIENRFSKEYKGFLSEQFQLLDIFQRIIKICIHQYKADTDPYISYIMERFFSYLKCAKSEAEYWIWGACERNERLARYLKQYLNITVRGFIDSDQVKQNGQQVIAPEHIDASKMYIIILLEYHQDIAAHLHDCGLKNGWDFFYPKYELVKNLKMRKMQIEDNEECRRKRI